MTRLSNPNSLKLIDDSMIMWYGLESPPLLALKGYYALTRIETNNMSYKLYARKHSVKKTEKITIGQQIAKF